MVFLYMAPEMQNPAAGRDARLRGSGILSRGAAHDAAGALAYFNVGASP
jgi:poly-gamma-glutamate capsule biosynthesis protein CapA/YwtB (metallophosphatase superfamily)